MADNGTTNWPLDTDDLNLPSDMTIAPTSAGDGHYTFKQWLERATGMLRATAHDLLTAMTHDVAMGGFKITGLPVPTATTEPVIKSQIDTDGTLAANSDVKVASQKAVKTYADALIAAADAMVFKGVIDCSTNPNYPAADRGWTYRVSVAGKIGGASGTVVEVGDLLLCLTDGTASGTQAAVGAQWEIAQANIDGAVTGPASSTDGDLAQFNGTSGKIVKDGGLALDTDGTLAANSDAKLPSQKAVKTYAQPLDTELTALAALVSAADSLPYFTGSGAAALTTLSAFIRTLLDDADAATARTTLGLGSLATKSTVVSADITDGTIVDADVAAANKDGATGTASLRTLGTGAQQAAAGTHSDANHSDGPNQKNPGVLSSLPFPQSPSAITIPIANDAVICKVVPSKSFTINKFVFFTGGTSSGNYDVGIYDSTGAALWRQGSTAWPGTNTAPILTTTAIAVTAGTPIYLVIAADNTSGNFRGLSISFAEQTMGDDGFHVYARVASSFPLPSSFTASQLHATAPFCAPQLMARNA